MVKKPAFEDNLINILNNRQKVDADTSFALSIVPLIKNLSDEQKTQVYIDILKSIQKVKEPKNSDIQTTSKPPNFIYPHAYNHHSNSIYSNIPQSYVTSPALHPNNSIHYNHPNFNPITPTYYPTTSTPNPSNTSIPYPSNGTSECEIQNFNVSKPF